MPLATSCSGVASVSLNLSVPAGVYSRPIRPLAHAEAGVTYDNLINSALLQAGALASGNTEPQRGVRLRWFRRQILTICPSSVPDRDRCVFSDRLRAGVAERGRSHCQ